MCGGGVVYSALGCVQCIVVYSTLPISLYIHVGGELANWLGINVNVATT